jgi:hypothetical protein
MFASRGTKLGDALGGVFTEKHVETDDYTEEVREF